MQDILNLLKPFLGEPDINTGDNLRWQLGWLGPYVDVKERKCDCKPYYVLTLDNPMTKSIVSTHVIRDERYLEYITLMIPSFMIYMNGSYGKS